MRTRAREYALQALFFMDIRKRMSSDMIDCFAETFEPSARSVPYFRTLAQGVIDQQSVIDPLIDRHSSNWRLRRMAYVDRNALRIAVYELLSRPDVPFKVAINEAINLGKKFGTEASGAFINGILDSIRIALEAGEVGSPDPPK